MVFASGSGVADGVALVRETGTSLKLIVDHVGEISSPVQQITAGAEEGKTIVQEVNSAVTLIDDGLEPIGWLLRTDVWVREAREIIAQG